MNILLGSSVAAVVAINMQNENTGRVSCLATVIRTIIPTVKGLGVHFRISTIIPKQ